MGIVHLLLPDFLYGPCIRAMLLMQLQELPFVGHRHCIVVSGALTIQVRSGSAEQECVEHEKRRT